MDKEGLPRKTIEVYKKENRRCLAGSNKEGRVSLGSENPLATLKSFEVGRKARN